jgi:hypothetical protein
LLTLALQDRRRLSAVTAAVVAAATSAAAVLAQEAQRRSVSEDTEADISLALLSLGGGGDNGHADLQSQIDALVRDLLSDEPQLFVHAGGDGDAETAQQWQPSDGRVSTAAAVSGSV